MWDKKKRDWHKVEFYLSRTDVIEVKVDLIVMRVGPVDMMSHRGHRGNTKEIVELRDKEKGDWLSPFLLVPQVQKHNARKTIYLYEL